MELRDLKRLIDLTAFAEEIKEAFPQQGTKKIRIEFTDLDNVTHTINRVDSIKLDLIEDVVVFELS